jgi:4-amino-4-deoxy-L-arabinose transferase-like glycosyltransferase
LIWLQLSFVKLLGAGELAIRLPVALAALFTCFTLIWFWRREFDDYWTGIIAALVLVSTQGYVHVHAARTGDYDALLTLFSTMMLLAFYRWVQRESKKMLAMWLLSALFAVYTKGVQGLLFAPAMAIFLFACGKWKLLLKKDFLIGIGIFISLIAAYYLGRNVLNPGYLRAIWENELGGRMVTVLDNHRHPFYFYFRLIWGEQFGYWWWTAPAGLLLAYLSPDERLRKLSLYLALTTLSYLLIISAAQTKLHWYTVPVFPLLALAAAIGINHLRVALQKVNLYERPVFAKAIAIVFLIWVFVQPYGAIVDKVYFPKEKAWDTGFYAPSYKIREALRKNEPIAADALLYDDYYAHLLFYVSAIGQQGNKIRMAKPGNLQTGETFLLLRPEDLATAQQLFEITKQGESLGFARYIVGERRLH